MTGFDYPGVFVTGTDTEIGKTYCSRLLMMALQQRGLRVSGMKPVASGADYIDDRLMNDDALQLQRQSSLDHAYELVNPYVFEPPMAPHLAAQRAGQVIEAAPIQRAFSRLQQDSDLVVVEGVGGWRVPLGPGLAVSDLPRLLNLPVVLVVGMRLGCLNHALLSMESIEQAGNKVVGWIANSIDPAFDSLDENQKTLEASLDAPCLARIPYHDSPCSHQSFAKLASNINISWL